MKSPTRPAIERMTKSYALIRIGKFPSHSTLAKRFEVSAKTIQRDLEFLRDRIGLPIEYNAHRRGWTVNPEIKLPWWL